MTDLLAWIFFGPAKLIALWPYAGVAIAGVLIATQAWLTWRARAAFTTGFFREAPVFAGLLWLIFNAFELQMSAVFAPATKSDSAILRLDLIVLVPILYVLTVAAGLSVAKQMRAPAKSGDGEQVR
ncbi:MAG: hypothetical protein ABI790_13620 [Betaproteobacteria bacterium]